MEKIKELCSEERPYEKCERFGAKHLTDIELLAVLLRSGSRGESALQLARHILYPSLLPGGILNIHNWSYEQLRKIRGIGKVTCQTACESDCRMRTGFQDAVVSRTILYGRYEASEAGEHEASASEHEIKAARGVRYFKRDRKCFHCFAARIVRRGAAEKCSLYYFAAQSSQR